MGIKCWLWTQWAKGTPPCLQGSGPGARPGGPGEDAQVFVARGLGRRHLHAGLLGQPPCPPLHCSVPALSRRSGPLPPGPLPSDPPAPSFCTPTPEAAQPPPHSSEAASHANVFRIHDISETSICIYLDSISKELFKIGAIWIDGCGTDCFLSVHVKNTMFSKWITNAVIIEMGTFCWGKLPNHDLIYGFCVPRTRHQGTRPRQRSEAADSAPGQPR